MKREICDQHVLDMITEIVATLRFEGKAANYIPELAKIPADCFGKAIHTIDGKCSQTGQADERFSIQSIFKLFTPMRAYATENEALCKRASREPSGTPFNSPVQLEFEQGIPRNPFINSGALVVTDILCSHYAHPPLEIQDFLRELAGSGDVHFTSQVAQAETTHGFHNATTVFLIKNLDNLYSATEQVLETYPLKGAAPNWRRPRCLPPTTAPILVVAAPGWNRGKCDASIPSR